MDLAAARAAGPVVREAQAQAATAWAAAWDAAWAALNPVVEQLQQSAIALFESMIKPKMEITV